MLSLLERLFLRGSFLARRLRIRSLRILTRRCCFRRSSFLRCAAHHLLIRLLPALGDIPLPCCFLLLRSALFLWCGRLTFAFSDISSSRSFLLLRRFRSAIFSIRQKLRLCPLVALLRCRSVPLRLLQSSLPLRRLALRRNLRKIS